MNNRKALLICLLAFACIGAPGQSTPVGQDFARNAPTLSNDISDAVPDIAADKFSRRHGDNFQSPQSTEQNRRRQEALQQRLAGKGAGKIHEIAKGQFVELELERTDSIFVMIVEYGDQAGIGLSTAPGPLHNHIPEPIRSLDNTTIWQTDFGKAHYEELYSQQLADYYNSQSSGRYTINGTVTEWVRVQFNGPRYGTNSMGDAATWTLIADAINTWTQAQLASGKTIEEIKAYLQTFDRWDRYDYDGDGNFDEPDGYIDHFQIVHAGEAEEALGGADTIWSHSWFAFYNWRGFTGPPYNMNGGLEFGGGWGANPSGTTSGSSAARVGPTRATVTNAYPVTPTGIFVGNYTIQPENGGLGVFAHEFAHDLGLPDHYDTSFPGQSSGTGFWNLMARGEWAGDGTVDIGSRPNDLMGWDKFQLGWLNYEVTYPDGFSSHRLGPAETNTKAAQALFVVLPREKNVIHLLDPTRGTSFFGSKGFWGGKGDLIDNSLTRQVDVPAAPAVLTMQLNYQMEADWDYFYVTVSTDGGSTWTFLEGTFVDPGGGIHPITTCSNPNGSHAFLGCGVTGSNWGLWWLASFDMSPFAGQTVLLRLRYKTDELVNYKGVLVDEITLGSLSEGAEGNTSAWAFDGFKVTTGIEPSNANHYYLAEYRQYRDYDSGLQTGPYEFGFVDRPKYVAHYPYQDGLLITYWDTGMSDDDVTLHPGEGRSLVVDAHPDPLMHSIPFFDGSLWPWWAEVQSSDATFGLEPTDPLHLPFIEFANGQPQQFWQDLPSLPPTSEFNDMNSYWSPITWPSSVIVPMTGTIIRVVNTNAQGNFMQVHVEQVK